MWTAQSHLAELQQFTLQYVLQDGSHPELVLQIKPYILRARLVISICETDAANIERHKPFWVPIAHLNRHGDG